MKIAASPAALFPNVQPRPLPLLLLLRPPLRGLQLLWRRRLPLLPRGPLPLLLLPLPFRLLLHRLPQSPLPRRQSKLSPRRKHNLPPPRRMATKWSK